MSNTMICCGQSFPRRVAVGTTAATIADYVRDRASFVRDVARQKRAPGQRVVADAS
jgi:hypothetical protein